MTYRDAQPIFHIRVKPHKKTIEELEALVRWREWALEEARKELREAQSR
jgi:hypothetical protein